jgi:hypothetical protein
VEEAALQGRDGHAKHENHTAAGTWEARRAAGTGPPLRLPLQGAGGGSGSSAGGGVPAGKSGRVRPPARRLPPGCGTRSSGSAAGREAGGGGGGERCMGVWAAPPASSPASALQDLQPLRCRPTRPSGLPLTVRKPGSSSRGQPGTRQQLRSSLAAAGASAAAGLPRPPLPRGSQRLALGPASGPGMAGGGCIGGACSRGFRGASMCG